MTTKARRRSQAERSEEMRARVLDAALSELAAKGYAGLRTADVVAAAGVSRGALTHHFPSKDSLVVAVVEHVFRKASETGTRRAHDVRDEDDVIGALIADSREFFFSELFLVALDLAIQGRHGTKPDGASLRSLPPEGAAVALGAARRATDDPASRQVMTISAASRLPLEAAWLDALVARGIARKRAEDILWLTISIVRGLAIRRLWQHDPQRFNHLFRVWRDMVKIYLTSPGVDAPAKRRPITARGTRHEPLA